MRLFPGYRTHVSPGDGIALVPSPLLVSKPAHGPADAGVGAPPLRLLHPYAHAPARQARLGSPSGASPTDIALPNAGSAASPDPTARKRGTRFSHPLRATM
jgi:hypothetical protein